MVGQEGRHTPNVLTHHNQIDDEEVALESFELRADNSRLLAFGGLPMLDERAICDQRKKQAKKIDNVHDAVHFERFTQQPRVNCSRLALNR